MRRLLILILATFVVLPGVASGRARVELRPGRSVLWSGPHIDNGSGETFDYSFDVTARAERLRIGFDHPTVGDTFGITVTGAGDEQTSFTVGPSIYSDEKVFYDPKPGAWQIEVTATDVTDSAFRVRAKLERRMPSLGVSSGPVLPNLQVLPPHAASFMTPVTNGSTDLEPTGLPTGLGCHPEEYVEDHAVRCLRFGFGVRNTGRGPMDLTHRGTSPFEHDLFQNVYWTDRSWHERAAGTAVFHKTHGHWHHANAVALQLFSVTDRKTGALTPAGNKRMKGFAHRNELLRDWDVFYPTIVIRPSDFGLRPGWADIYEWDRPGNYIDFGLNPDGYYVVRMWVDPTDGIRESNEKDNEGYTYMKVEGNDVTLLEAGRGTDPWDPCKIVVGFGGFPDPPRASRPADCLPDTT